MMEVQERQVGPRYILFCVNSAKVLPVAEASAVTTATVPARKVRLGFGRRGRANGCRRANVPLLTCGLDARLVWALPCWSLRGRTGNLSDRAGCDHGAPSPPPNPTQPPCWCRCPPPHSSFSASPSQRRDGHRPDRVGGAWREGARGGAWERRGAPASVRQLPRKAVGQPGQVLLPKPDEIVEVALADEQGGFGANEAAVVPQLGWREVAGQDGVDHALPPLQVLLQLLSVVSLAEERRALVEEGVLDGDKGSGWLDDGQPEARGPPAARSTTSPGPTSLRDRFPDRRPGLADAPASPCPVPSHPLFCGVLPVQVVCLQS